MIGQRRGTTLRGVRPAVAALCAVFALSLAGCASSGGGGGQNGGGAVGTGTVVGSLKPGSVDAKYVKWVNQAGSMCPEISPPLIAAQIQQESGWNPNARSGAGAEGIAQFMPGTWTTWGVDADGNGSASPFDSADAIVAQGKFMCSLAKAATNAVNGHAVSGVFIQLVLGGYNAGWGAVLNAGGVPANSQTQNYVVVIPKIAISTYGGTWSQPSGTVPPGASSVAGKVLAAESARLGTPYVWGGGTLTGPSGTDPTTGAGPGFDCSGFTRYGIYVGTGGAVTVPRTAAQQQSYLAKYDVANTSTGSLQPGDMLFFGSPASHVGMYYGGGKIIEEAHPGSVAHVVSMYSNPTTVARIPWSSISTSGL